MIIRFFLFVLFFSMCLVLHLPSMCNLAFRCVAFVVPVDSIDKTTYDCKVGPLIFTISATACAVQ